MKLVDVSILLMEIRYYFISQRMEELISVSW